MCANCKHEFREKENCEEHLKTNEEAEALLIESSDKAVTQCPFCSSKANDLDELKAHIKKLHIVTENKVGVEELPVIDVEGCVTDEIITCNECDIFSGTKADLESHVKVVHTKSLPEPFPCEVCGLVLATFELLESHLTSHAVPTAIQCKRCDFSCIVKAL